mmetsp:Transcript_65216/g.199484  ORF Transcript_65216/g.199484 Transcript_65216/m.199484 type:complete len:211 (-) Transcript_65216:874-1506(-)
MTVLCTPSKDTWSMTYSFPLKNSWQSTAAPWLPTRCWAFISTWKCSVASSMLWHSFTPSDPADSTGLTTTGMDSLFRNSSTSEILVPPAWRTDRRPLAFTSSCWIFLSRRWGICVPFVRTFICSDKASAHGTPVSPPQMMAISFEVPHASLTRASVASNVSASVISARYSKSLQLRGLWAFISSEISFDHRATILKPRLNASCPTQHPVE